MRNSKFIQKVYLDIISDNYLRIVHHSLACFDTSSVSEDLKSPLNSRYSQFIVNSRVSEKVAHSLLF